MLRLPKLYSLKLSKAKPTEENYAAKLFMKTKPLRITRILFLSNLFSGQYWLDPQKPDPDKDVSLPSRTQTGIMAQAKPPPMHTIGECQEQII